MVDTSGAFLDGFYVAIGFVIDHDEWAAGWPQGKPLVSVPQGSKTFRPLHECAGWGS